MEKLDNMQNTWAGQAEVEVLRKDQKGMVEMKNSVAERLRYKEKL